MKHVRLLLMAFAVLGVQLIGLCLVAQTSSQSQAIGLPYPKPSGRIGAHPQGLAQTASTPIAAISGLQCATVPTSTTASFEKYYSLTTDVAASLGISWIGSATASGESQQVVLIREYRKYSQCPTTDGSGQLQYGAALRATVQVSAESLQASLNFAVVAANATLKNLNAQVYIENIGFNDNTLDTKINASMQEVASSGLNVQTFGAFSKDLETAITEATTAQLTSPFQRLAFIPNSSNATLTNSVATIFGLSCMAKGWGCIDAQAKFPGRNADTDAAIQQVYTTLTNSCSGVNDVQKATAQSILSGVATSPSCHN